MSITEYIVLSMSIIFCVLFIGVALYSVCTHSSSMSKEFEMDCDFRACEQMRESNWSEEEIEKFMNDNKGYYDEHYK